MTSGYKQTDPSTGSGQGKGVIPEDWTNKRVADFATTVASGKSHVDSEFGDYPVHGSTGIIGQCASADYLGKAVLVARVGANAGKLTVVDGQYGVTDNTIIVRIDESLHQEYFWRQLEAKRLNSMVFGSGQPLITGTQIKNLSIPVPPTKAEQEAIAGALSDADALIESLEQLIAKKRHLKQGAMQELLTGKKRLPGFSGEWEVKLLDELANIRSGGTPSTSIPQFWDGNIPWCTPTDITALDGRKYLSDTSRMITPHGLKSSSAEMIPAHSIVMTSRATIGECAINTIPVSTNQGFKNFVPFETTDVEFLYYLLTTQKSGFISLCGGSTFLEIGKTQLIAYQVRLPATKTEQTAIATILSDMDAEIAALETQLTKTRSLKQGMMHNLLTGKIRLI